MLSLLERFIDTSKPLATYEELTRNFSIHIPADFNFTYDIVDEYARIEPGRRALVWCNDENEEHIFSFRDLSEASARTAHYLYHLGIRKGDAVMLILRRRYEFWFFILALHRLGAIAVPATNMLLASDIEYRNNTAGIKAIVTLEDDTLQKEVEKALVSSPTVQKLVTIGKPRAGWETFSETYTQLPAVFPRPTGSDATHNDDIMLLYFTSGTSGYPKMVQHNYSYPLGHIVTAKFWQNVVEGGLHLTVAETGWAKAVWGKLYGQWIAGSAVFAYDMLSFVPARLLEKMQKYQVTTFCAPPTVYRYLIRQDLSKYDLSHLVYCVTAGEALNDEVYTRFYEKTGLKMYEGYGQTELTLTIGNFPGMEPKPGSMGKPAPGYHVDIVDSEGNSCSADEVGEIVLRLEQGHPFGMFAGYYHDEKLSNAVFQGNLYHTGDTAYRDEDGYYWFIGRTDDMIKSAGYRISPFEVESVLQKHPAVLESAVTGVNDEKRGQIVKATIVLSPGYEASKKLSQEIQEFVKHQTAPYKYPRIIEFTKELPKTISGKIRRVEIREQDQKSC